MRIDHLELSRYGCFTDRSLDLSGPGVQLVVGPNEAGKSTVRRAIGDLLYGIPERTTLGFVHDMRELRLGARLRSGGESAAGNGIGSGTAGGATLDLVRLKQRKEPLQTPEGEPLAEGTLSALLAGIGRAEFESTFAFDHAELRRGGRQLLEGEGDLGSALFETRSNRRLTDLLDALDERMGKLFKRNAQNPSINAALSRIAEARKQVNGSLLRPADYDRVARAKDEAGKKREQLREEFRRVEADYARLKRTLEAKPLLADLARLQQERADLEPADSGIAGGPPSGLSAGGATILRLGAELTALRERARDAAADTQRAEANHDGVRAMLAELVVDDAVLAAEAEVERLHADRNAVQETAEQERLDRTRAEKTRAKAQKLLGAASSDEENKALAAALKAVIKAVPADLLSRGADRTKQVAKLERSVRTLREKHALPETVENWPGLPVPAREQVTAFKEQFTGLDARQRELSHRHEEAGRTLAEDRRGLATVLAGDPPPSEPELAAARSARDAAWLALREVMLSGEHGREADFEDYAAAVRHADALADRMRREAQRQNDRLRLEVAVEADEQVLAGFAQQLEELDQTRRDAQARWAAAWLPSAVPEPDPAAATDLLAGIEALAGRAAELADAQAELDTCQAEIESAEARLRQSLSVSTSVSASVSASAPDLADAALAELLELAAQRRTDLEVAGQQREKADTLLAEAAELEAGADAKAERVSRFAHAVAAAARACGGGAEGADADAYAVVASLNARLLAARQNSTSVELLSTQAAELDRELAIAAEARRTAGMQVGHLVEAAGAENEEQLDAMVERATAAADLDRRISDLTSPLTRTGVPLPTLIRDAADWPDPDRLASAVTELADTLRERQAELDAASEEYGSRSAELTAMDGSAAAAQAAEQLAGQQAVLLEDSEEYLRLHLGRELLRRCIEDYQQANQDPVLARAQELFATLTGGRFTELTTDLDQHGRDILRVRRANGSLVNIGPELSEGTLDQLYLALRLAALQRYADAERTMPLVFDDIFITSDDARTAAGLTALDGISDQFQIIVFTHHDHLAAMAREILPAGRVHVTELPTSLV